MFLKRKLKLKQDKEAKSKTKFIAIRAEKQRKQLIDRAKTRTTFRQNNFFYVGPNIINFPISIK